MNSKNNANNTEEYKLVRTANINPIFKIRTPARQFKLI